MESMQKMVERDIKRYTNHGIPLEAAVIQVKGLRRGHWDAIIDKVAENISKEKDRA